MFQIWQKIKLIDWFRNIHATSPTRNEKKVVQRKGRSHVADILVITVSTDTNSTRYSTWCVAEKLLLFPPLNIGTVHKMLYYKNNKSIPRNKSSRSKITIRNAQKRNIQHGEEMWLHTIFRCPLKAQICKFQQDNFKIRSWSSLQIILYLGLHMIVLYSAV